MNLLNGFRTLTVAMIATILFSCNSGKKEGAADAGYAVDSFQLKNKKFLFNDTTKAKATIEINILLPKSTLSKDDKALIESCFKKSLFGRDDAKIDIQSQAKNFMTNYLKEYKQLEAIFLKDQEEFSKKKSGSRAEADLYEPIETAYNYEHRTDMSLVYNTKELLSYTIQRYDYTGGAHGMTTDSCFTILMKQKRLLMQEDLFEEAVLDEVSDLITKKLAKDNDLDDPMKLEEQGYFSVKEIYPNGNIYATEKGITWVYNPYDIAAYALGTIKVTLTYADLKSYLKPNNPLSSFIK